MDFQVNYGALDGAAADIKSGAANLQGCLDDLENTLNQLRSSWEGQAQEAYNAAQVKWNQGLEGLKDVLSRTSAAVDSARSNYQQTDQSNAARFCEHERLALPKRVAPMGRPFSVPAGDRFRATVWRFRTLERPAASTRPTTHKNFPVG